MKLWFKIFCCCMAVSIASCKYSHTPDSVARKFLISFNQLDFATAKSLSTKNTWPLLDIMAEATHNISAERKSEFAEKFTVKIRQVENESDSTVIVTFQTEPKRLPFNQLRLFKTQNRDGKTRWKVDISTLDLLNSEEEEKNPLPDVLKHATGSSGA